MEIKFTTVDSRSEFSALKVLSPDPIAVVDAAGQVYVYTKDGQKLYTGLDMPMPADGYNLLYETLRELGLRCAAIRAERQA